MTVFYCREDNTGTCHIKTLAWQIPKIAEKVANKVEVKAGKCGEQSKKNLCRRL
jgi:hypothetical protein